MPCIRPDSDLINNYDEISDYCHKSGEPVFITQNGYGDLVVMSIKVYEKLVGMTTDIGQISSETKSI